MAATSNDINLKIKSESLLIKEDFIEALKIYAEDIRKEIILKDKINFKNNFKREYVQEKMDSNYFSLNKAKNLEELYEYIINPKKELENEYNQLYLKQIEELQKELWSNKKILELLKQFLERINIMFKKISIIFDESNCYLKDLFRFQSKKDQNDEKQLPLLRYSDEISVFLYTYINDLFFVERKKFSKVLFVDDNIEAELIESFFSIDFMLNESPFPKTFVENFTKTKRKIYNPIKFLNSLGEVINDLIPKIDIEFLSLSQTNRNDFISEIKIIICDEKCPCCNRLCGFSDNTHKAHKCLYGHQMRALGGIKLSNDEASVSRCEDIRNTDIIKFNGNDMTWLNFKKYWSQNENNIWSFDDISQTRDNQKLNDRFKIAWTLIGEKVCNDFHKGASMKYVAYNQENIDNQINAYIISPIHYIFLIDSSS